MSWDDCGRVSEARNDATFLKYVRKSCWVIIYV